MSVSVLFSGVFEIQTYLVTAAQGIKLNGLSIIYSTIQIGLKVKESKLYEDLFLLFHAYFLLLTSHFIKPTRIPKVSAVPENQWLVKRAPSPDPTKSCIWEALCILRPSRSFLPQGPHPRTVNEAAQIKQTSVAKQKRSGHSEVRSTPVQFGVSVLNLKRPPFICYPPNSHLAIFSSQVEVQPHCAWKGLGKILHRLRAATASLIPKQSPSPRSLDSGSADTLFLVTIWLRNPQWN